jgi:hypothetical protein
VGGKGRGGGRGEEMNQALYAHMNNKRKMKKKRHTISLDSLLFLWNIRILDFSQWSVP